MGEDHGPLYGKDEAESLQRQERSWGADNMAKFSLLLDHLGPCRRLVDIGCGWGQFLAMARGRVPELWGVDESPERARDVAGVCPEARVVICRADRLQLRDGYFDVVVTSQMLHEVKLFGGSGELGQVLREIRRVLAPGGRYLLLDHHDAGDGEVLVRLPGSALKELAAFEGRFRCYSAWHCAAEGSAIRIARRALQDYLTKNWSLGTPMEAMEMAETHNVFTRQEAEGLVEAAGLVVREFVPFSDIRQDLTRVGGELVEGEAWYRKFLLVSTVPPA